MPDERSILRWWRHRILTAWLLVVIAPTLPVLVILIVVKFWQLAWPFILVAALLIVIVVIRRLVANQSWRWR